MKQKLVIAFDIQNQDGQSLLNGNNANGYIGDIQAIEIESNEINWDLIKIRSFLSEFHLGLIVKLAPNDDLSLEIPDIIPEGKALNLHQRFSSIAELHQVGKFQIKEMENSRDCRLREQSFEPQPKHTGFAHWKSPD
ncbi:hypothetical protein KHA90_17635 [Flavobacterium psychroterrae]|uniref:Uncharacterized protein n=1 Tax=Flavobacterium psychroterrae TaxID=2133767 RepID=A0ABS5PEX3_9FLAO|nr:hypothetical protein [Flavobacterium psychroterrae]MBS7232844.1 hypothetical protein [Flavobacterium psychroterrae]